MKYKIHFYAAGGNCKWFGTWYITRKHGLTRQDVRDVIMECRLLNEVFHVKHVRAEIVPQVCWAQPIEISLESDREPGRYPLRRIYIGRYGEMPMLLKEYEIRS